ncbi:MAG: hypothetical protein MH204_07175 [Fimbriimonadaceae bacterium]|nr:hypothetical protein [Fimbriimonadaceae bacterium]
MTESLSKPFGLGREARILLWYLTVPALAMLIPDAVARLGVSSVLGHGVGFSPAFSLIALAVLVAASWLKPAWFIALVSTAILGPAAFVTVMISVNPGMFEGPVWIALRTPLLMIATGALIPLLALASARLLRVPFLYGDADGRG